METTTTATSTWKLDASHSEVGFTVKHLMINNVKGHFDQFDVHMEADGENLKTPNILFTAQVNSINTGNDQRDQHLKSADFFDAELFPMIKFEGKDFTGDQLIGEITLHGIKKTISLHVEFGGIAKDPWGNTKAGFTLSGKINRKDFGLNWNAALETGGVLVGNEVKINAEIQMIKEQ